MKIIIAETGLWKVKDTFATRIHNVRRELKLSAEEFGAVLGVTHGSVVGWENGASPKNMAEIALVLEAKYGVIKEWLMWGDAAGQSSQDENSDLAASLVAGVGFEPTTFGLFAQKLAA